MSSSNTNFFGTFLDTLARDKAAPTKTAGPGQAIDAVLKTLHASTDPLRLSDLMPAANNSAGMLLEVLGKLESAEMVSRTEDGRVELTGKGKDLAALTR